MDKEREKQLVEQVRDLAKAIGISEEAAFALVRYQVKARLDLTMRVAAFVEAIAERRHIAATPREAWTETEIAALAEQHGLVQTADRRGLALLSDPNICIPDLIERWESKGSG